MGFDTIGSYCLLVLPSHASKYIYLSSCFLSLRDRAFWRFLFVDELSEERFSVITANHHELASDKVV